MDAAPGRFLRHLPRSETRTDWQIYDWLSVTQDLLDVA
jgi:hypothetical protein